MIVILTALPVEYAAVRAHLLSPRPRRHPSGTVFEVGSVTSHPATTVAVANAGMGNHNAATLTERAITQFRPAAVLFAGVAGGLRDWLHLGDVVVASKMYGYHGGKSADDGFHSRPQSWAIAHVLEQEAKHLDVTKSWHAFLPADRKSTPDVHFSPIAAGEVVLDSAHSGIAGHLRRAYNDAIAVEMESAGFAAAGQLNNQVAVAAVRGISDKADGGKERTDTAGWQRTAAGNAAAFAIALAVAAPVRADENPESGSGGTVNIARDNAKVGQQNTTNFGETRIEL